MTEDQLRATCAEVAAGHPNDPAAGSLYEYVVAAKQLARVVPLLLDVVKVAMVIRSMNWDALTATVMRPRLDTTLATLDAALRGQGGA